ncbi:DUF4292 domain-containing protein [Capnocytophaga stomatis]|uniref:DUF4292 domain-containing protein n=1 Tax=Capnocytophaga stomatis TaxID=1848904 RepID=UPI00385A274A
MKKIVIFFALCLFLVSCKSKKNIITSGEINKNLKAKDIVEKHKNSFPDFKTLNGSVFASYDDGKGSQSISLSFRMEKDKAIWLSAPLGIAKAYITPEKASYYNRLDGTHFNGDFSYISKLLGFDVNFENLQNLLLGQSIYPLTREAQLLQGSNQHYILEAKQNPDIDVTYGINPGNFRLGFFDVFERDSGAKGKAEFSYQQIDNVLIPATVKVSTLHRNKNTSIELTFNGIKLNENVNFPFKIPSGTKEIK